MQKPANLSSILLRRLLTFFIPAFFVLSSLWTIYEYASSQNYASREEESWVREQKAMSNQLMQSTFAFIQTFDSYPSPFEERFPSGGWQLLIDYLDFFAKVDKGFFLILDSSGGLLYDSSEGSLQNGSIRPFKSADIEPPDENRLISLGYSGSKVNGIEPALGLARKIPGTDNILFRGFFLSGSKDFLAQFRDWQGQVFRNRLLLMFFILALFVFLVFIYFRRLSIILASQTGKVIQFLQIEMGGQNPQLPQELWVPEIRQIAELAQTIMGRERAAVHKQLEHESRYRSLFFASGESIIIHSLDGRIHEMNEQARLLVSRMNLWAAGAVQNVVQVKDIFPLVLVPVMDRHLEQLRKTYFAHWEGPVHAPSGMMHLDMSSYAVDREADLAQTLIRDVSNVVQNRQKIEALNKELTRLVDTHVVELDRSREEIARIQAELVQKEKLGMLVTVLASLGHEIETPLGIGVSLAALFQERSRELKRAQENGDLTKVQFTDFVNNLEESSRILLDNMERAGELMRNLKELAVDQASTMTRDFSLGDYLRKIVLSLQPKLKKLPHSLSLEIKEALFVRGNPGSLYQILVNLINNSLVHAFAEGEAGSMVIRVENDADRIYIRYLDNGKGIGSEVRAHIFEPYFTTRRDSGGSGLGMHIVKSLVEDDFGGTIILEDLPGWSTCFLIALPRLKAGD